MKNLLKQNFNFFSVHNKSFTRSLKKTELISVRWNYFQLRVFETHLSVEMVIFNTVLENLRYMELSAVLYLTRNKALECQTKKVASYYIHQFIVAKNVYLRRDGVAKSPCICII